MNAEITIIPGRSEKCRYFADPTNVLFPSLRRKSQIRIETLSEIISVQNESVETSGEKEPVRTLR